MIVLRSSTKAGRAWIEAILANATSVLVRERDLLTDQVSLRELWRDRSNGREGMPQILRALFTDRYTQMFDPLDGNGSTFYVIHVEGRVAKRYEITKWAFDPSGLPDIKPEGQ